MNIIDRRIDFLLRRIDRALDARDRRLFAGLCLQLRALKAIRRRTHGGAA